MKDATKKICPRCEIEFSCLAYQIEHCQCSGVSLSKHHQAYIAEYFKDCLCLSCLEILKLECDWKSI